MRWLHLSDIHFNNEATGANTLLLRNSLRRYLKDNEIKADRLFITGDFRYKGKPASDIQEIYDYILEIANIVGITDLSENLAIIPGNHDLDRSKHRGLLVKGVRETYSSNVGDFDHDTLADLINGFSFYDNLFTRIYGYSYREEAIKADNPHKLIACGAYQLLLLNTAILSNEDQERGNLIIGTKYIIQLLEAATKPVIVLAHHGLDNMGEAEKRFMKNIFRQYNVKLYLCGDAHRLYDEGDQDGLNQITMGCLRDDQGNSDMAFAMGQTIGSCIKLCVYEWRENWAINNHIGRAGIITLDASGRRIEPLLEELEPKLRQHIINEINYLQREDIALHTPQVMYILLQYPGSTLRRILNEYRNENQERYGNYLYQYYEEMNQRYKSKEYGFGSSADINDVFGMREAKRLRTNAGYPHITENMLAYSILSDNTRRTIRELEKYFEAEEWKQIKELILKNVTP